MDNRYALPELHFIAGEAKTIYLDLFTEADKPVDATYFDTNLTISHYSDRFVTPLIDKSLEIGSNSADDVPYVILKILPSETADLNGLYIYQVSLKYSSNPLKNSIRKGKLYISKNSNSDFVKTKI